ncbi:MAG: PDZ domain-containing protein [Actinomycetales bacterium]|nr:PDZ domain-containing protein [Actinomycetales bacterium]
MDREDRTVPEGAPIPDPAVPLPASGYPEPQPPAPVDPIPTRGWGSPAGDPVVRPSEQAGPRPEEAALPEQAATVPEQEAALPEQAATGAAHPYPAAHYGSTPYARYVSYPMAVPDLRGPDRQGGGTGRGRLGSAAVLVTSCLVTGLLGGVSGAWLHGRSEGPLHDPEVTLSTVEDGPGPRPRESVAGVARAVLPGVVALRIRGREGTSAGSGFVIDADGYVLTNNHVVAEAAGRNSITVVFQDGSREKARLVGRDPSYDLAVVKVDRRNLRVLALGDSDDVVVGDPVVAVGAPLGLQGTVTYGIVSALNRPVLAGQGGDADEPSYMNAIQTDAAINPGNSGGPLVDAEGRVIGVASAFASPLGSARDSAGNIGLGFAIPSVQARRTAQELIRTGHARHPVIGVLLDPDYEGEGVRVMRRGSNGRDPVEAGGPADRAGIREGDVITRFEGRPVSAPEELIVAIRAQVPGDRVTLTVRRGGRDRAVEVRLDAASE